MVDKEGRMGGRDREFGINRYTYVHIITNTDLLYM